jgi:hypothetical protein
MGAWLRRRDEDGSTDRRGIRAAMPASVRVSAAQRDMRLGIDIDEDDADVEFLSSLVEEVARDTGETTAGNQPAYSRSVERTDGLDAFREMADDRARIERFDFGIPEIDMDDLLEDLTTTALALRRRKAA